MACIECWLGGARVLERVRLSEREACKAIVGVLVLAAAGHEAQLASELDRFDLLILDDLSCVRRDQIETSVLFELIAERHERLRIALTVNTPLLEWGAVFVRSALTQQVNCGF